MSLAFDSRLIGLLACFLLRYSAVGELEAAILMWPISG